MKIYLVLGASGSGKTTYIENNIIKQQKITDDLIDEVAVSIVNNEEGNILLFGKYNVDKRCKGCDTLSMSIIDKLLESLESVIKSNQFSTIVIDGDRVNNNKMFQFLSFYKNDVEVIFIDTSLDIIYARLPQCNKVFVKTTHTKTLNSIILYQRNGYKVTRIETKDESKKGWF